MLNPILSLWLLTGRHLIQLKVEIMLIINNNEKTAHGVIIKYLFNE
jgi:hypothetical protein